MAAGNEEFYEIYWTRDESIYNSDSEGVLRSFVPGVDQPGSRKPTHKTTHPRRQAVQKRALRDEKIMEGGDWKMDRRQRRKENEARTTKTTLMEVTKTKDRPSLKDLRPEDKKRIANLIRELAKVGEEKEVIVEQLNVERRSYEDKVGKLQQQMDAITQERELTQKQYLDCQKLLAEYQSQLASEQEKLASEQEKLAVTSHHQVSPSKINLVPQLPAKATSDNILTATNQSFEQRNGFQQRTPRLTNQQPATRHVAQGRPNGYPTAPHQTGYGYPGTHPAAAPSLKQGNHLPGVEWNRPLGTQRYPVPSAQQYHPATPDPEFNPALASTHRSHSTRDKNDGSWAEPMQAGSRTPAMYVSYGNTSGYVLPPGLNPERGVRVPKLCPPTGYPKDSQETLASQSQSGEFRPLHPELETDFESQGSRNSPEYVAGFRNHPNSTGPMGNNGDESRLNTNHQEDFHTQDAVTRQPTFQTIAGQRHDLLEKQRLQLHREQAWLRKKLRDQEEMLRRKQGQLEIHQLAREQQQDYRLEKEWQGNGIGHMADPRANTTDPEWEEPNLFNGMRHEASSESDNDDVVISTNYPPANLENSMRQLNLSQGRHQRSVDVSNTKAAWATRKNTMHKTQEEANEGFASLYPNTRSRHTIQGSTSSHSPSTSSSPTLVDQSTSPLYRDRSTVTAVTTGSPGRGTVGLSPGSVHVTAAPEHPKKTSREPVKMHQRRLTERRGVFLPLSPRYHSDEASVKKRNVTQLSDLISEMESPPPNGATPDLFQDDTDTEMEESRILEDVFFFRVGKEN